MHNAGEAELKALLNLMNGEGRGRSDRVGRVAFSTPTLSSANVSWVHIARELKRPYLIYPLVDRIMEFGRPAACPYVFEGITTREEFRIYGNELRRLARNHFGWAGPEFARRLERWMKADLRAVEAFVAARREAYHAAAADIESSCGRDVGRISNRFATLYVAGCLAIRFQIFPFTEAEVLEALLTCHRDHVAFVDEQLSTSPGIRPAIIRGQAATTTQAPIKSAAAVPVTTPFERLRRFVHPHTRCGFVDLRGLSRSRFILRKLRLRRSTGGPVLGYVANDEYWLPYAEFVRVAGGAQRARTLKLDLVRLRLIKTVGRGGGQESFVAKRSLPDGQRQFFVVLRHHPQEPPPRG